MGLFFNTRLAVGTRKLDILGAAARHCCCSLAVFLNTRPAGGTVKLNIIVAAMGHCCCSGAVLKQASRGGL